MRGLGRLDNEIERDSPQRLRLPTRSANPLERTSFSSHEAHPSAKSFHDSITFNSSPKKKQIIFEPNLEEAQSIPLKTR